MKKLLAAAIFIILLTGFSSAYVIEGDSVIFEDSTTKLTVTPHTASSPTGNFEQIFEVENKTNQIADLYIAYVFDEQLTGKEINLFIEPVYDWQTKSYICNYSFDYNLNVNPSARNPNYLECFYTIPHDNNSGGTIDEKIIVWNGFFNNYDFLQKKVYYDEWKLLSGNYYNNVTSNFGYNYYNGKHYYYSKNYLTFDAFEIRKWKTNYNILSSKGKFNLIAWKGDNWNCIFNDTCTKVWELDPWFDNDFLNKRIDDVAVTSGGSVTNFPFLLSDATGDFNGFDSSGYTSMQADCNDFRVVDDNEAVELYHEYDVNREDSTYGCKSTKQLVWVKDTVDNNTTDPYIYYGNAAASDTSFLSNAGTWDNNYLAVFHISENATSTIYDSAITDTNEAKTGTLTNVNLANWSTGKIGYAFDFDGQNDFVNFARDVNLDKVGGGEYTLEAWVFADTLLAEAGRIEVLGIGDWASDSADFDIHLNIDWGNFCGNDNYMSITHWVNGDGWKTTCSSSALNTGEWYHVMGDYNGTNLCIYVNGVQTCTAITANPSNGTSDSACDTTPLHWAIARGGCRDLFYWDGKIDEVRISDSARGKDYALNVFKNLENELGIEQDVDVNATFSDLNLFQCNSAFTENVDLNISADFNVVFDFNITKGTASDVNADAFKIFYMVQEFGDDLNCVGSIRNEIQCGWRIEDQDDISFDLNQESGDTNHWQTSCEDDHAFKQWAYNLNPEEFETKGTPFVMNSGNIWLKTLITNARDPTQQTDVNIFYNFSFSANFIGISKNLELYACNQDIADPTIDDVNCNNLSFSPSQEKELDTYYSIFRISNDLNQLGVNNVVYADGNFWIYMNCTNCSAENRWEIDTVDTNSNIDRVRNWDSSTGVENLVPFVRTVDTHIHWQDSKRDHNFIWLVQTSDFLGTDINSSPYIENIENVNLPPSIINIITPVIGSQISGLIDVNVSVLDPNSGDIIVCDLNIIQANGDMNTLAEAVVPINNICSFDFNTLTFPDGTYRIHAQVRETNTPEGFSADLNQDAPFIINNILDAPVSEMVIPNGGEQYDNRLLSTATITFTINDIDSNSFLIDLNYSDTNTQGSGTEIINDINTNTATITCGTQNFFNPVSCSYTWNIDAVADGNYYILLNVTDGNSNVFDVSAATFEIFTSIALPSPAQAVDYERFFAADDPRKNLIDTNRFLDEGEALNQDRLSQILFFVMLGVIVIIIFIGVYVYYRVR